MFKASIETKSNKEYNHHSDLFDDTFFSQIAFFDFSKPAPIHPPRPWATYICEECKTFEKSLNQILDRYSLYLESDTIDLIELLISTSFMGLMCQIPTIIEIYKSENYQYRYNFFRTDQFSGFVKDHTTLLSELIGLYNINFPDEKIKISTDINLENFSPQIGSARISNQDNDSNN